MASILTDDDIQKEKAVEGDIKKETSADELDGRNSLETELKIQPKREGDSQDNIKNDDSKRLKTEEKGKKIMVVPPTKPLLFYTPLKTGLVYDVRMRYHAKIFTSYFEYIDPHPEDPRRIYRIYKKLAEAGLIQDSSLSGANELGPLMLKIPIREATKEEILEVHSEAHLNFIASTETMSREALLEETQKGDSIYVNNDSFFSAKLSCGGVIEACKAVVEGRVKNSLAVVRPPGHHAEPDAPAGFCLFSNVAVAAKNILKNYPESVRRIVIVDWDIHHGNGTQKAFYNDPRVLYISLHRYENGKFYPGTKYGNSSFVGEGAGEGFNVNIPWKTPGMHDGDYFYAFNRVVIPIITEFDPDLIIVSSGFDAADGDIIGCCHVSPIGYGHMTHMLKGIAKGKLCVVLEGGYNLDSISRSALAVTKILVGEPPEDNIRQACHIATLEVIDEVIKIQSKYWNCMKPGNIAHSFDDAFDIPARSNAYRIVNISNPIRAYQADFLFQKFSFINLPIVSSDKSSDNGKPSFTTDLPSMDDLVLASPDLYECTSLVILIHDPPDIWASVNPVNGCIEGSTSLVLEYPLVQMMDKIKEEMSKDDDINERIGYIDINIPSFALPQSSDNKSMEATFASSTYNPIIFSQELLLYVWDNYVSYFSQAQKIIFVGFGESYQSIVHLFAKRPPQEIKDLVKGSIAFVDRTPLKPLQPVMDESMVDWFYHNSLVFTSCENSCWVNLGGSSLSGKLNGSSSNLNGSLESEDNCKKPRRKFGRVLRASVDGLWDVITERFDEGVDFILDSIDDCVSDESE